MNQPLGLPVLFSLLLLPGIASSEIVLFHDDFNDSASGQQPMVPPWASMSANDLELENYLLVRDDFTDDFGEGSENRYLEFRGSSEPVAIAASVPESEEEVVTLSFDFIEPDGNTTDPLIIFLYTETGSTRADRLRLTHGGTGASAPDANSCVYALNTVNRLDWIRNNSGEEVTYLSGTQTLPAGRSDLWINGNLILDDYSFEAHTEGPIVGFNFTTFSNIPNQRMLIDNVSLVSGARVRLPEAAATPLLEFLFEGDLTNTGSAGGEGTFVHERENDPLYNYVWQNRASIGAGLGDQPNSGLDNTQVGGMGNYGQGELREGGFFFPSDPLHNLQSVTVAGWYKTPAGTPWSNEAHMVGWPNSLHYQHQTSGGTRVFVTVPYEEDGSSILRREFSLDTTVDGTLWQQFTDRWTFHAVTFDGTTGTMSFYYAFEDSESVTRNVTRTGLPVGPLRNLRFDIAFANSYPGHHPFKGHLDNIRVFGSKEDGSGALSLAVLNQIWAKDLADASGGGELPAVTILDMVHDGDSFAVSFEAESGYRYIVETSSDLNDWNELHVVEGDGSVKEYADPVADIDRKFYRVRVERN